MSTAPESFRATLGDDAAPRQQSVGDQGLYVFLLALGVAFGAAFVAYVLARTGALGHQVRSAEGIAAITVPLWFWFSTFFILLSSAVLHYSKVTAGVDRPARSRRALLGALLCSWIFLGLQVPGLVELVRSHRVLLQEDLRIYALLIFLVALHALHVAGGIVPMTLLGLTAHRRPLGPARYPALRRMTIYWHFLALVWIVMFNGVLLMA
jgi:heme/copper-type cytochrome/quinol oxidase subunit 3